jgi:glucosamine-phosphate N-acetyltransferase
MEVVIRKIREEDFKEGFIETIQEALTEVGLTPYQAQQIYREWMMNSPFYHIFVAEIERKIVGAATLIVEKKFIHRGGLAGRIEDVAVRPAWQRRGIGSQLIKAAIETAKEAGCYKVTLSTSKSENIPFYEKLGFKVHGTTLRMDIKEMKSKNRE